MDGNDSENFGPKSTLNSKYLSTYMTENVMATVEFFRKLIIWIIEVFEAVLPQSHFLE